jgi:hypothetical protein
MSSSQQSRLRLLSIWIVCQLQVARQRCGVMLMTLCVIGLAAPLGVTAAGSGAPDDIKILALPEQSIWSKLYHGTLGFPRQHIWFVIADTVATVREANDRVSALNGRFSGLRAEVYRPADNGRGYLVVVGQAMKVGEAQELAATLNKSSAAARARIWSPLAPH